MAIRGILLCKNEHLKCVDMMNFPFFCALLATRIERIFSLDTLVRLVIVCVWLYHFIGSFLEEFPRKKSILYDFTFILWF